MGALKAIKSGSHNGVGVDYYHSYDDTTDALQEAKGCVSSSKDLYEKTPVQQKVHKNPQESKPVPKSKPKAKGKICRTTFMSDGTVLKLGRRHRASLDFDELQRTGK